jgi:hypothetical protein
MTDQHRFGRRANELRAFAERIAPLAKMPDRATGADLQLAAELANKAASDLDELVAATPPGCICRLIEDDNYSYLDYAEACRYHGQLYTLREDLKARHEKMVKALKNETRMRIVLAALTGAALTNTSADKVEHDAKIAGRVGNALDLADEVLKQITETA